MDIEEAKKYCKQIKDKEIKQLKSIELKLKR